jgi:hypothetical protein
VHYDSSRALVDWSELEAIRQRAREAIDAERRQRREYDLALPEITPARGQSQESRHAPADPADPAYPASEAAMPREPVILGKPAGVAETDPGDPRDPTSTRERTPATPGDRPASTPRSPAGERPADTTPVTDTTPRPLPRLLGVPTSGTG